MEEEEYGGVNERRRNFMKGAPQPPSKYDLAPLPFAITKLQIFNVQNIFVPNAIENEILHF